MATYEFPLSPMAQKMTITLGDAEYQIRFAWCASPEGGWFIDLATSTGAPLVTGLPLAAGESVLQQFDYLGIGGGIYVATDNSDLVEPTYENLGANGKVYFVTP